MALNKEVWLNTIVENFFPDNSFASKSVDDSAFVDNKTVHVPNAGTPSGVVINRTTLPATVSRRTDYDLDYDIDELYSQTIGIYLDDKAEPESIYLKVTEHEANFLRDLPLHPSQFELGPEGEGYVKFRLRVIPNEDLVMELKRLGSDVEVLSPLSLRSRMARELQEAADKYK